MEPCYRYILFLISHLSLALLGYWYRCQLEVNTQHEELNNFHQKSHIVYEKTSTSGDSLGLFNLPSPNIRSPVYLIELAKYETTVVRIMTNLEVHYSHLLTRELLERIDSYLDQYSQEILRAEQYSNVTPSQVLVAENPILTFNMIRRFAYELPTIHVLLQPFVSTIERDEERHFIADRRIPMNWPSSKTTEDAMSGLFRLQMVYDLDPKELSSGIIYGVETGASLKIQQILVLGEFAQTQKAYTLSIPWFELAIEKLLQGSEPEYEKFRTTSLSRIQTILDGSMAAHDAEWDKHAFWERFYFRDKLIINGKVNPVRVPFRKLDFSEFRRGDQPLNDINYWSLCSGDNHQTEAEKSILSCWYDSSVPFLYINPIKLELLSAKPYIVQMYDVISDSTSTKLIQIAQNSLSRSQVTDMDRPGFTYESTVRTSVEGWVYENEKFTALSKFIEASTGLSVVPKTSSQDYLVASYAYSGHYDCHLDAFEAGHTNNVTGNRIATMMFYLNDTQKGGFTAFPQAGVAARPIKGSAVFWFNLKLNGAVDRSTYHCACPVVLGHKTISTKWILHHDQFRNLPCGLNEEY